ncbi:hypothetical protein Mgra_00008601 [Meloidogyne graminicola]|uniref:Uncharacterized protein n=1 Tax=Meloidogyne graminicola TaxID=189291 RepID=A0A8S9ZF88_9BILA|nr:hypothetical protein Mgra_00008601 [Meloidogyne graminicola]
MKIYGNKLIFSLLLLAILNLLNYSECLSLNFFNNKEICDANICPDNSKDKITCTWNSVSKCCPKNKVTQCATSDGGGCCPAGYSCCDPKDLTSCDKCYSLLKKKDRIPNGN